MTQEGDAIDFQELYDNSVKENKALEKICTSLMNISDEIDDENKKLKNECNDLKKQIKSLAKRIGSLEYNNNILHFAVSDRSVGNCSDAKLYRGSHCHFSILVSNLCITSSVTVCYIDVGFDESEWKYYRLIFTKNINNINHNHARCDGNKSKQHVNHYWINTTNIESKLFNNNLYNKIKGKCIGIDRIDLSFKKNKKKKDHELYIVYKKNRVDEIKWN